MSKPPKRTFEITRPGKHSLELLTPVMCAAGAMGYGSAYKSIIKMDKLGAIVTHPISYESRSPANGTRFVPLDSGVLMHTGLPNPGLSRAIREHGNLWLMLPVPIIVHLIATNEDHVRKGVARIGEADSINAVELGLYDDITWQEAERLVRAAAKKSEKPLLVRLPLQDAYEIADAVADAGADALVVSAPPRGTAHDPLTGRMVSGRVYGPLVKPMALYVVERLAGRMHDVPIIGAGGIHSAQDARDFINAGARAVQVDAMTWIDPRRIEIIARDLAGMIITRDSDSLPDEWYFGMGETDRKREASEQTTDQDVSQQ